MLLLSGMTKISMPPSMANTPPQKGRVLRNRRNPRHILTTRFGRPVCACEPVTRDSSWDLRAEEGGAHSSGAPPRLSDESETFLVRAAARDQPQRQAAELEGARGGRPRRLVHLLQVDLVRLLTEGAGRTPD